MISDRLHLIDFVDAPCRGDDQFDIGIVDDFDLRGISRYDFVIYVDEMQNSTIGD